MLNTAVKVLIIDDMKTMRKLVTKSLTEMGFSQFLEAEDGAKGWEVLSVNKGEIGLVVSDWNMPNCTGLDLLKRVRSDGRFAKMPFVLVTAESEKGQVIEALKVGVSAYVIKPFDTETLKSKLMEAQKKMAA